MLTLEQYSELKAAQDQLQVAQTNLQRVMRMLGLDINKAYSLNTQEPIIPVEEMQVGNA